MPKNQLNGPSKNLSTSDEALQNLKNEFENLQKLLNSMPSESSGSSFLGELTAKLAELGCLDFQVRVKSEYVESEQVVSEQEEQQEITSSENISSPEEEQFNPFTRDRTPPIPAKNKVQEWLQALPLWLEDEANFFSLPNLDQAPQNHNNKKSKKTL